MSTVVIQDSSGGMSFEIPASQVIRIDPSNVIYSEYRGWMSPDGDLHRLYGVDGHTKLARQFLGQVSDDPIKDLHDAGWIRVVCSNAFSCHRLNDSTRRRLLGIVLKQRDCATFFFEIGRKSISFARDDAIEYLGGTPQ